MKNLVDLKKDRRRQTVIPGTDTPVDLVLLSSGETLFSMAQAKQYWEEHPELTLGGDSGAQLIDVVFVLYHALRCIDGETDSAFAQSPEELLDGLTPHQTFALMAEYNELSNDVFSLDRLEEKEFEQLKKSLGTLRLNDLDGVSLNLLTRFLRALPPGQ